MMTETELENLFNKAATLLKADIVEDRRTSQRRWYVDVYFDSGRRQRVFLTVADGSAHYRYLGMDRRVLHVTSYVGPFDPNLDAAALLRKNAEATLATCAVFDAEHDSDQLQETLYTTCGLPLVSATPEAIVAMIDESAGMADSLEEELFAVDRH